MRSALVWLAVLEFSVLLFVGPRLSTYRKDRPVKGPFGWPVAGPTSLLPSTYAPAGRTLFWVLCGCLVVFWATVLWLIRLSNPLIP